MLYNNVKSQIQNFDNLPDVEKLAVIVLHFEKSLICYLHNSWNIRQNVISKYYYLAVKLDIYQSI